MSTQFLRWGGLRKLDHAAQVAGFKPPAKLLRELLAQLLHQLASVLGTFAAQHFGGQALAHCSVQAGEFGIHRTGQALAAAGDEGAQLGVQLVGRRGRCAGCDDIHGCNTFVR